MIDGFRPFEKAMLVDRGVRRVALSEFGQMHLILIDGILLDDAMVMIAMSKTVEDQ